MSPSRLSPDPLRERRASRRGTYNRHWSPSERARAQRAELLSAVRQVVEGGAELTVANIASARGLGRNTFYEHFTTVENAVRACVDECAEHLTEAVSRRLDQLTVATPGEHGKAFGVALHAYREQFPDRWQVLLSQGAPRLRVVLRLAVERVHQVYVEAGAARGVLSALTVAAAVGAVLGILTEAVPGRHAESVVAEEVNAALGRLLR